MAKSDTITQTVTPISWQQLCELRRQQLEAWKAAQPTQPAQFDLKDDYRPAAERTAAERSSEPACYAWYRPGSTGTQQTSWKRYRNFTCAMRRRAGRIISPDFRAAGYDAPSPNIMPMKFRRSRVIDDQTKLLMLS